MEEVGAALLIIDPLLAHIPAKIDGYKDQHVRQVLAPLHKLAEDLDCAVLGVMHLNKRETSDIFSRLGGSGGFLGAARSALLVAPDPNDADVRVVAHGKANLTREAPSLRFKLEPCQIASSDPEDPVPINVARVAWLGESDVGIGDLLRGQGDGSKKADAIGWLAQELAHGPLAATIIEEVGGKEGHSWATLKRAKEDLGVKSYKGGTDEAGRWYWTMG